MLYRIMTEQYKDLTMTLTNEAADVQERLNKQTAWYYIILLAVFLEFCICLPVMPLV